MIGSTTTLIQSAILDASPKCATYLVVEHGSNSCCQLILLRTRSFAVPIYQQFVVVALNVSLVSSTNDAVKIGELLKKAQRLASPHSSLLFLPG